MFTRFLSLRLKKFFPLSVLQLAIQPYICGPVSSFITARPMANGREGGKLKMDEFGRPSILEENGRLNQ